MENETNEPTPEEIAAEIAAERMHHETHQKWLEKRVALFTELAGPLAAHTKDATDDHDVDLAQQNKVRVLNALDELLLPPSDSRSPIERFMDGLGHGLGEALKDPNVQALITGLVSKFPPTPPIVEKPETEPERMPVTALSDAELDAEMNEAAVWFTEVRNEKARRERPIVTDPPIDGVSDEWLAQMAARIAAERERRAAPPPGP